MERPFAGKLIRAIVALPFTVVIVIPAAIVILTKPYVLLELTIVPDWLRLSLAVMLLSVGLTLLVSSVTLFYRVGRGTLAAWDATQRLVIVGPYRFTRNPMISGVALVLVGESLVSASSFVLLWATLFIAVNHTYFVFKEEPDLQARFGQDYLSYKKKVPRWIPRFRPWKTDSNSTGD